LQPFCDLCVNTHVAEEVRQNSPDDPAEVLKFVSDRDERCSDNARFHDTEQQAQQKAESGQRHSCPECHSENVHSLHDKQSPSSESSDLSQRLRRRRRRPAGHYRRKLFITHGECDCCLPLGDLRVQRFLPAAKRKDSGRERREDKFKAICRGAAIVPHMKTMKVRGNMILPPRRVLSMCFVRLYECDDIQIISPWGDAAKSK
jgi:hypothetical protein